MESNDSKNNKKETSSDLRNAVQQIRPDDDQDTIMRPATKEEVKEAVREINPDEETRERG